MIVPQPGVVIAGRYTLVRPLARGGMGSVWIAHHRDLEVDVTVKFMAPALVASPDARLRFEREAKGAARLRSQHVVQVHDYGVEDDTPYIVMELLKGESLWTRIAREGRLPLATTARLLVQICKALRTAHEAGLVHRDLKPGNIFLAQKDDDEVVTVLDFGIAKTSAFGEATADTDSGVLLGSVHYMSPEQIRNSRKVDHRSDLWAVGVILYRTLTGRLPFPGENVGDVLVRVCTDPWPAPSTVCGDLPTRVDAFFERAMARDPDHRFQSAPELAEAFSAMALEAPAPAPPVSQPPPQWRQTRPMIGPRDAGTMRIDPSFAVPQPPHGRAGSAPSIPVPEAVIPPAQHQRQPLQSPLASPPQITVGPSLASPMDPSPRSTLRQSPRSAIVSPLSPFARAAQSALAQPPQSTPAPPAQSTFTQAPPSTFTRLASSPMLEPPSSVRAPPAAHAGLQAEPSSRIAPPSLAPQPSSRPWRAVGLVLAGMTLLAVLGVALHFRGISRSSAAAANTTATPASASPASPPPPPSSSPSPESAPNVTAVASAPETRAPEPKDPTPPKRSPVPGAPAKASPRPSKNLLDRSD